MPKVQRAPYFPKDAANAFAKYKVVIFLDVPRPPTAMFGYRDSPTKLFAQNDDDMWFVDPPGNAMMLDVLRALAMEVNIGVQCAPKMSDVAAVVEHVVSEALAKSVEVAVPRGRRDDEDAIARVLDDDANAIVGTHFEAEMSVTLLYVFLKVLTEW